VRSPLRTGADASLAEPGASPGSDAFTSVLAGQKRPALADRDPVDPELEPDPATDQVVADETADPELAAQDAPAKSDDMMSLLASLMASAAIPAEPQPRAVAEVAAGAQEDPGEDIIAADVEDTGAVLPDADALPKRAGPARPDPHISEPTARADAETKAGPAASTAAADAAPTATVATAALAGQATPATATPLLQVAAAQADAGARTAPARPQPAAPTAAREKAALEDKETLRTLGMASAAPSGAGETELPAEVRAEGGAGRRSGGLAGEELAAPKTAPFEVIDSRRFMPAQSLNTNAQMLTRSLVEAGDAALAASRAAPAQAAATQAATTQPASGQMLHTLKLQLNPISLGSVTAVLKLTGEELSVSIQVETAEAYRQLKDDNQSILKAMRAQGYAVEQITVQHVTSPDRPAGQTPQQGFQGGFQGSGSNDAQSSSSGRNDGGNAGQQGARQNGGQSREQNPYPGAGAVRTDGVYL
tara:strand:- start:5659 stop:7092 length:1434 start_codon:yes stop_codon:yes gene_type:complete